MLVIILCLIFLLWQQKLENDGNDNNGTTETTSSQHTQTLNFNNYELSAEIEDRHGYCVATVRLPGRCHLENRIRIYPDAKCQMSGAGI